MNYVATRRNAYAAEASAAELKDLVLEMTHARSVRNGRYTAAREKAVGIATMLAYAWGYVERTGIDAATAGENAVDRLWTRVQMDRTYLDGDVTSRILASFRGMSAYEQALHKAYSKDLNATEAKGIVLDTIRDSLASLEHVEDTVERSLLCRTVECNIRCYYRMFLKKVMNDLVPGAGADDYQRVARVTYLRVMADRRREGFLESLTPAKMLDFLREYACTGKRIHATTGDMAFMGHLSSRDLSARIRQMALESNVVRRASR